MKNYKLDDIMQLLEEKNNNKSLFLKDESDDKSNFSLEEIDDAKTRILKYIFYKKRTEQEIRKKFHSVYDENLLNEVIDNLKSLGYISDTNYIEKAINEYMTLNKLSIKEIKYKLMSKGIKNNVIDEYVEKNYDDLMEYERKSAKELALKKANNMDETQIKTFLFKKGYKQESIKGAL